MRIGTRVRICECSGVDSGKVGRVAPFSAIRTDGRGIPTNIQGAYRPLNARSEVVIRLEDGTLIAMYKNRVLAC